jgi:hypothetical protein
VLGGISQSLKYLCGVILFGKRTGGAGNNALSAVDTGGFCKGCFESTADDGVKSTVVRTDDADSLNLFAGSRATAAENALAVVTDDGKGGVVDLGFGLGSCKFVFVYTIFVAELLQLTSGGTGAGQTLSFVSREYELEVGLAYGSDLRSVGLDFHAFVYGIYAGCNETARTGNFNETETACADFVDVLEVAESGDVDIRISAGFKYGDAGRYRILSTVYFNIYHIHK